MIAEELLSEHIIPLKRIDSCEAAVTFMHDAMVTELPVVEQGKLLGYMSISQAEKLQKSTVGQAMNSKLLFVPADTHLFDVACVMQESGINTIAVCDEQQQYVGAITLTDLLKAATVNTANTQPGAIVTLQVPPRDYSLTELARITESNDFKIIGVFIRTLPNQLLEINLKFNSSEIKPVLHAFERYNYTIKTVHQLFETGGDLDNRLDWLIKYINT